jgi:UDP:flavonoid glycosyltransferase YjiC (YdhE family)
VGQDIGYRPETPVTESMLLRSPCRNAMILLDLENCDRGWCPNHYQRSVFPARYHDKIEVIPEGVDTHLYRRDPAARLRLGDGSPLPQGTKVVTYVSRGFELMRGFDVFMKAAKRICEAISDVIFVVVGSDRVCYGGDTQLVDEKSFKAHVLKSGNYDLSRFCFTGAVSEAALASILSVSDLHVYLTVPFVPSWSLLDAMSCSCVVLASDQACTREYVTHGVDGLLCDFFDDRAIAEHALQVLEDPPANRRLGAAARRTVEQHYALDLTLPRIKAFFEDVAGSRREVSVRAEILMRKGTLRSKRNRQRDELPRGPAEATPGLSPQLLASLSGPCLLRPSPAPGTVLFVWEFGGGLGHVMQILPLARALVRRGHRVFVALPRLKGAAARAFEDSGVIPLQAPTGLDQVPNPPFRRTEGFGHILANVWSDGPALTAGASAWRNLLLLVRPDVAVFDYGPTAQLASRGMPVRRALIGSGFCCPPDTHPFPPFSRSADPARLAQAEQRVRCRVNRVLRGWRQPEIDRLGRLYSQVHENFLTTLPELEQYPSRQNAKYWGPVLPEGGETPEWPEGDGRKVFAYLKRFDGLEPLAAALHQSRHRTLLYVDGLSEAERRRMESPSLRVTTQRVDLRRAAAECDAAVLHAGQGATAAVLLAGKPLLQVPLVLEQHLTADATARLGAGEVVTDRAKDPAAVQKLDALLDDPRYKTAARGFARRYSSFDPAAQLQRMVARVEELVEQGGRGGDRENRDKGTRGHGGPAGEGLRGIRVHLRPGARSGTFHVS